jgi:hypothetical protein
MPEKKPTLNRFPLFGLFAYRAAGKMGYPEADAHLLGYSTALLYAIFKAKAQARKEKPEKEAKKKELPKEQGNRGQGQTAPIRRPGLPGHLRQGDPFVSKTGGRSYELAAVYLACAVVFLLLGPGRFSVDALLFRKPPEAQPPGGGH